MKTILQYGKKALFILRNEGWASLANSFFNRILGSQKYHWWWHKHKLKSRELKELKQKVERFEYKPKISIIMPVYNGSPRDLKKAVQSVLSQIYPYFELCICDDASTDPNIPQILKEYADMNAPRIKITQHKENKNISVASNSALSLADGEYAAFLDQDDELALDALYRIAEALQKNKADILYTDEDKINEKGFHNTPFFKPDWAKELLLSMMYLGHLLVYRRMLINEVGGFRVGFEGSQDFDLALRCTEKTQNIIHIPHVLYHWRQHKKSTSKYIGAKSFAIQSAHKALSEALRRRNLKGEVLNGLWLGSYRIKLKIEKNPKISIIIPFRDEEKTLRDCLESIKKSTYKNTEIILVNNLSEREATKNLIKEFEKCYKVIDYPYKFNFSKINNAASKKAGGDFLLFLNNDTIVIEPEWLEAMLEWAMQKDIAAVGAKLLYPNNTIQHAGIMMGIAETCSHSFRHVSDTLHGYLGLKDVTRNVSAVTGACLMMEKKKFEELGGFDENFEIAYQDVDLGLRALEKGYRNIYTPFAKLYHFESLTAKEKFGENDTKLLLKKWGKLIEKGDHYYNPNLSRRREDYRLN